MRLGTRRCAIVAVLCLMLVLHVVAVIGACAFVNTQVDAQSLVLSAALVLMTAFIDIGVVRYLLGVLRRSEQAYTADVTRDLEESLVEYREQAERERLVAQEVGAEVEQQIASAREALASGNITATDNYLHEGMEAAAQAQVSHCDNVVVASVLESKARQCAESGVDLVSAVVLPDDLPMEDAEVAAIFFNLIDNALHECEALIATTPESQGHGEPLRITVRSDIQAGQLFVEVTNPCRKGAEAKRQAAARRVDATVFHGLGTSIVSDIAVQHGGVAEFAERDGTFVADVMIPLG